MTDWQIPDLGSWVEAVGIIFTAVLIGIACACIYVWREDRRFRKYRRQMEDAEMVARFRLLRTTDRVPSIDEIEREYSQVFGSKGDGTAWR